jgi:hypothetical protein
MLSLALVGAGTAIAQSTSGVGAHTSYVQMVGVDAGDPHAVLEGTFSCDPALHQELVRKYLNRPLCEGDGYAYAYPEDTPAPWEAQVTDVEDDRVTGEDGSVWHVAEVTYRTVGTSPEGGPELVTAMASELVPKKNPAETKQRHYQMSVEGEMANQSESLEIDPGPAPDELSLPS